MTLLLAFGCPQGYPLSPAAMTALAQALVAALLMNISIVGLNQVCVLWCATAAAIKLTASLAKLEC